MSRPSPLAAKFRALNEELRRLLEKLGRKKDAVKDLTDDPEGFDRPVSHGLGPLGGDLGALFRGRPPVTVQEGGGLGTGNLVMSEEMGRLANELGVATAKCAGVANPDGRREPDRSACREAGRIREQMSELVKSGRAYVRSRG